MCTVFLDMETKKIVHSRDVMWLGYKFYESSKNSLPVTSAPEDNHEDEEEIMPFSEDEDEGGIVTTTNVTSNDSEENTVEIKANSQSRIRCASDTYGATRNS